MAEEAHPALMKNLLDEFNNLKVNSEMIIAEINSKFDSFIQLVNIKREKMLEFISNKVHEAQKTLKDNENTLNQLENAKTRAETDLTGTDIKNENISNINKEISKISNSLKIPQFSLKWRIDKIDEFSQLISEVGSVYCYYESIYETLGQPIWATNLIGGDGKSFKPGGIAFDYETNEIFVGDQNRISIFNQNGDYLRCLIFQKLKNFQYLIIHDKFIYSSIERGVLSVSNTLYKIEKQNGVIIKKVNGCEYNGLSLSKEFSKLYVSQFVDRIIDVFNLNLQFESSIKLQSSYFKTGLNYSIIYDVIFKADNLICLVSNSTHPIQIFSLLGVLLKAISLEGIPVENSYYGCFLIGINNELIVNYYHRFYIGIYTQSGSLIKHLGGKGESKGCLFDPKGISIDSNGHLIVVDNKKLNSLQSF